MVNLNAALVLLMELEQKTVTPEAIARIDRYLERVKRTEPGNKTLNKLRNRLQAMTKTAGLGE